MLGADRLEQERIDASRLVERARARVAAGDLAGFADVATMLWRKINLPINALRDVGDQVAAEMDPLCDTALPPPWIDGEMPTTGEARLRLAADVLDVPWPTRRRETVLLSLLDGHGTPKVVWLDALAEEALAAPTSAARTRLLRLVVSSRLGATRSATTARVLAVLHEDDALDADLVDAAFTRDELYRVGRESLGSIVFGEDRPVGSAGFRETLRTSYDELVWDLTAAPDPDDWNVTPKSPSPRGLRFVLRGLDVWMGRLAAVPVAYVAEEYVEEMVDFLCSAELTGAERTDLIDVLGQRPDVERQKALRCQPSVAEAMPASLPAVDPPAPSASGSRSPAEIALSRQRASEDSWHPPTRPACSCPEHAEDVLHIEIPEIVPTSAASSTITVASLIEMGSLTVDVLPVDERTTELYGDGPDPEEILGPFHWCVGHGDEVRCRYDDRAALQVDQSMLERPGIERVFWYDREVFYVGAPTLCESGVLAAAARALADRRVRES